MQPFTVHTGRAVPLRRANVDTDQIIPAAYLKRTTRTGFAEGLLRSWRQEPDCPLTQPDRAGASILVTGPDFGTGSSREHAVWALQEWGFRAVVSPRFGDIFRGNALKGGLLPVEVDGQVAERLMSAVEADAHLEVTVDLTARTLRWAGESVEFPMDEFTRWRLLEGLDDIGLTLRNEASISAYEAARAGWFPLVSKDN